jgi:hypothetical protein
MNFDKVNLRENVLIITNEDGSITIIPEDGATIDEQALFTEFRSKYPEGNPVAVLLDDVKQNKIQEMSNLCGYKMINEFYSTCLGDSEHFDCGFTDQSYIQGLASKATLILNGIETDGVLEWKKTGEPICYPWTPQQCIKLGLDMFNHITTNKKRYEALRQYINSMMDISEVQALTWDIEIPSQYFEA